MWYKSGLYLRTLPLLDKTVMLFALDVYKHTVSVDPLQLPSLANVEMLCNNQANFSAGFWCQPEGKWNAIR